MSFVYLDANASHPLLARVREGLSKAILEGAHELGNSASIHRPGQKAKAAVARLRALIGRFLGRTDGDEIILLSGATEALNLCMRGFVANRTELGRQVRLVVSAVEHSAVLDTAAALLGVTVDVIPVDGGGQLDERVLMASVSAGLELNQDILVVLQAANNETGVLFDLEAILPNLRKLDPKNERLWIALDAAQAVGKLDEAALRRRLRFADYAALSAHKIGGPAGIGALWVHPGVPFSPQMTGGAQERKRRAGTLNGLGAYAWALALEDWAERGDEYRARMRAQRERLLAGLRAIPGCRIHGAGETLPNTVNFRFDGCPEESLLLALDLAGFAVSSGSACNSGSLKPSHVLTAMGIAPVDVLSSLRVCTGAETTDAEVEAFLNAVKGRVEHIRAARRAAQEWLPEI